MKSKKSNTLSHTIEAKSQAKLRLARKFVILIVLYAYLAPIIFALFGVDDANYRYLDAIGFYLLVVVCILIFGLNQLETFRDKFSLGMIVLSCFLAVIDPRENNVIYKIMFIILGATISIYLIINRKEIMTPSLKSFLVGLLWSIGAVVVLASISVWLGLPEIKSFPPNLLVIVASVFWSQLALISIVEEVAFRGLIFSLLIMIGWNENNALITQAILFWGWHYVDIGTPKVFFVIVPLGTLFMTLIIKKYKMVYMSALMHTLANVFVAILSTFVTYYLF